MNFKYIAAFIPFIPIILKSQDDFILAEKSGDLSYGMSDAYNPKLPSPIHYLISLFSERRDSENKQALFFPYYSKSTYPINEQRAKMQVERKDRLADALEQVKQFMNNNKSNLLLYMQHKGNDPELTLKAKQELFYCVISQWIPNITITLELLSAAKTISSANKSAIKNLIIPNKTKFSQAKKTIMLAINQDPTLCHHIIALNDTFEAIEKLKNDLNTTEFQTMLKDGRWSPAAFLAQAKIGPIFNPQVTNKRTNLNGILPCTVGAGRLILIDRKNGANDASGLFRQCCAGTFLMDLLTLILDRTLSRGGGVLRTKATGKTRVPISLRYPTSTLLTRHLQ